MSEDKTLKSVPEVGGIDEDQFIVPAKNTSDHSVRLWFRTLPGDAQQIESIVQTRIFPYKTKSQLLRHALHRHLKWLHSLEKLGKIKSVMASVDAMLTILRDDEYHNDYREVVEMLNNRVNQHKGQGEFGEARRLVLEFVKYIGDMPDGFWKEKYKKKVLQDHDEFLKSVPKADLLKFEEG